MSLVRSTQRRILAPLLAGPVAWVESVRSTICDELQEFPNLHLLPCFPSRLLGDCKLHITVEAKIIFEGQQGQASAMFPTSQIWV